MALKVNINVKNFPLPVKIIIGAIPAVAIIAAVLFLLILPKNKEIKELEKKIAIQENEIAADQVKVAKLSELTLENER
jgi:cell division protein FtsL